MLPARTFIAIGLPAQVREALSRCQEMLGASRTPYVKWVVDPGGIHLTLKFLGNVEETRLPRLAEAMERAVADISPFQVQTGAVGAFPNARSPRVLWIGLEGDLESLQILYRAVEEALAPLGFPREGRPFAPHLTLGRVRETAKPGDKHQLGQALAGVQMDVPFVIPVEEIHVMKSDLARTGARYTSLYTLPLRTGSKA
ncbi:MAG: RNA 2',3'-cyclic phosphodiesterase [Dehalococcoidia bacterium]|nr:RNA 2',3'-cyclic phosphodiesterase [Dehalococcoidia bacterium]